MRILALVSDAYGSHGGISKFNRDILTAFCAHPKCVEVVALPRLMNEPPGPMPGNLTWVTDGLGGKLRYIKAVLKSAMRDARSPASGFDLVFCGHINLLPAAFLARHFICRREKQSRRRQRLPIALMIHGLDVWQPHRSALVRYLSRQVDAFVSVSQFTRERFEQWSLVQHEKAMILPNCVDLTGFEPGEKDPTLLKKYGLADKKVMMTFGRLLRDRPKGIDEVLELLPDLAQEVPQLAYLIAGDGPDRSRLEAKAAQLGVRERVVFAGRISEAEKAAHYRLADAFVMPGYGEGFGIVYLEALACGLPVLASTLDASREALGDGKMGLLVDPRNRNELRQGVLRVLEQPRGVVPMGLEYFSFPNFVQRCHGIIDRLCPATAPV